MTLTQIIELLNNDLANEYKHMHFYMHSSFVVQGLHREEYREFFWKEAQEEMKHIQEFANLILGFNGNPIALPAPFPHDLVKPEEIISYAYEMEKEVVENYVQRIDDATKLGQVNGKWLEIFLENQIIKSKTDVDNYKKIIDGM